MNSYASLRKRKSSVLGIVVIVLLVVELFGLSMLASQITTMSAAPKKSDLVISLTDGSPLSTVTVTRKGDQSAVPVRRQYLAASVLNGRRYFLVGEVPGFQVSDDKQVWTSETDIEIFRLEYDNNGDGKMTVVSGNGDKVIAPGTENDYTWTLANTGSEAMTYTMLVESWFEGGAEIIPVEVTLQGPEGYMTGSATEWKPVLDLNQTKSGGLNPSQTEDYTLNWRWPFERTDGEGLDANDAFDTMLGNLSADGEPMSLHIRITIIAEQDEPIPTGEGNDVLIWSLVSGIALVLIVVFLFILAKKRREEEAAAAQQGK